MRPVGDFYSEPGMAWSLRSVGPHLHPGSEEATVALARAASDHGMATGGVILDVASALGAPARFIARRFASRIVCVDMDPRMHRAALEGIRREGLSRVIHPLLARTERLPLAAGSCDGAWSQDALCHMDKDAVLAEVARVLRPGALFAFTDFIARPSLTKDDLETLRRLWAFPSLFTVARYASSLDRLGFELLRAEDRTGAILANRTDSLVDDELWWYEFTQEWGEAEATGRLEAGRAWQALLTQGRAGYALFVVRLAP
ncbi:MAG: class I SAM-dependent methyltransferase [Dehalococcoidia bacterium]